MSAACTGMTLNLLHTSCSGVTGMAVVEELKGLSLVTTTELDELDTRDTSLQSLPHKTAVNRSTFFTSRFIQNCWILSSNGIDIHAQYFLCSSNRTEFLKSRTQTEFLKRELDHYQQNLLVDSIGAAYQDRSCSWEYWIKQAQHNLGY